MIFLICNWIRKIYAFLKMTKNLIETLEKYNYLYKYRILDLPFITYSDFDPGIPKRSCKICLSMRRNANKIGGEDIAKFAIHQSYRDIGDLKTRKKQLPLL